MALDGTYSGLKASIADFLNRTDLAAAIPDFITLAEAQMNRRLRSRAMIGRADAAIAAGEEYLALPGDFIGPIEFGLQTEPATPLQYLETPNLAREKACDRYGAGHAPVFYGVVGSELQLYPVAARWAICSSRPAPWKSSRRSLVFPTRRLPRTTRKRSVQR